MRELSYEEMRLVAGGHCPEQCTDPNCDRHDDKDNSCSWKEFGRSTFNGAVTGGIAGAGFGSISPGTGTALGFGVGAIYGALGGMAGHIGSCWW